MIKTYCDVCGKQTADAEFFEEFQFCAECWKKAQSKLPAWELAKAKLFKAMFAAKPCACKGSEKCACKKAAKVAVKTTCKGKEHAHELLTTTIELAKELDRNISTIQCYTYRNKLGTVDAKRHVKVFSEEEANKVRKHFNRGGK